ncbi:MAG: 50S ribosomal protein L25/general stress protein Ctc [Prochloraceae cyanobacterium]|nr:50S ribosomal protein L25/general stress protein Ctc [Prochloraceae cyanobacterium]
MELSLECKKRPEGSKPRALRREGFIPAALYGHQGAESISLVLKKKEAEVLLKKASLNNTLIDINIPEVPWSGKALIREVQTHPWKNNLVYHLSFFSIAAQKSVEVSVPINLVGEAAGIKMGGIMEHLVNDVKVQCPPDRIPESIDADISHLKVGQSFQVGELVLPEGIQVMDEPKRAICSIAASRMSRTVASEDTEE